MGDIRLLQWSDFHGDLGKYEAVIALANKRKVDACMDLGDMVDSKEIVKKTVKEILGESDPTKYMTEREMIAKAIAALQAKKITEEEFQKKFGEIMQRIEAVDQKIIETHHKTYQSIDEVLAKTEIPKYFVSGNHDFFGFPTKEGSFQSTLKNATPLFTHSKDQIYDICGLKVFARTNTNLSTGLPKELCPHLNHSGVSNKELKRELKKIKDKDAKEAKTREIVEADETYKLGKDLEFDLFVGHGQIGDTLTDSARTLDEQDWPYPVGALHLAKEKKVPYFGGHTHHAVVSNKDGFPGFITGGKYIFEHVFDSETRKLKETIVYRIEEKKKSKTANPAAPKQKSNPTAVAA